MNKRSFFNDLWAEHMRCEFELKDAEATMETMTDHPFVNHIPTLTGGNGYDEVYRFYKHYFIPKMPKNMDITHISCTIDNERLVDEVLFKFVHDSEIGFMLPNLPPTGKTVIVPLVVIVYIKNNKVDKEHIFLDQFSLIHSLDPKKCVFFPLFFFFFR